MKRMKVWLVLLLAITMIVQCVALAETGWVEKKNGSKVLFSNSGKKVAGWYLEDGNWYYLKNNGMLADGWIRLTTGIYHADAEGHIDEGWQRYKGIWYKLCMVNEGTEEEPSFVLRWFYVDGSEELPFGTKTLAGKTYNVENKKQPLKGWTQFDGAKIYFNEDGTADTGWKEIDGSLYFFDLTGRMTKGKVYIEGEYYAFDGKGLLKDKAQENAVLAKIAEKEESVNDKPANKKPDVTKDDNKPAEDNNTPTGNDDNKPVEDETPKPVVETKTESVEETIPYETEYRNDNTRYPEDGNKTLQAGKNGTKVITYKVVYTDGVVTSREKTGEKVTAEPVKEIVSVPCKGHTVETKEETKEESVPFTTETREDNTRFKGEPDLVVQEGKNGVKTYVYTVTYTDGVETSRVLKSENVTTSPVNKIVSVAVKEHVTTTTEETETESVPFETEYVEDSSRYESDGEVVTREGVNGVRTKVYTVVKTDGVETSRTLKSDEVTTQPVNKIISRGTKKSNTKNITVTEEIPYETEERDWPTYEVGHNVVAQEGVNGVKEIVYKVTYDEAGNELSREKVSETVTTQPQKKIICVGSGVSTYEYEAVSIDLSPWMHGTRSSALDAGCQSQAMTMAKNGAVAHTGQDSQGESVGGWSSASAAASGVAAHGGETLAWSTNWGAGSVKVTKHKPNGATVVGYYACAAGSGEIMSPEQNEDNAEGE